MNPIQAIEILRKSGMTETVIGAAVGVNQSSINRIRNGEAKPMWELGQKLINMAKTRQEWSRWESGAGTLQSEGIEVDSGGSRG